MSKNNSFSSSQNSNREENDSSFDDDLQKENLIEKLVNKNAESSKLKNLYENIGTRGRSSARSTTSMRKKSETKKTRSNFWTSASRKKRTSSTKIWEAKENPKTTLNYMIPNGSTIWTTNFSKKTRFRCKSTKTTSKK